MDNSSLNEALLGLGVTLKKCSFYNDTVIVYYDDAEHSYVRYNENGEMIYIPSVTTITKIIDKSAALIQWAANMSVDYIREVFDVNKVYTLEELDALLNAARYNHRTYKEEAADTGKLAHDYIDNCIKESFVMWYTFSWIPTEFKTPLPEDPRAISSIDAAFDWINKHKVKFLYSEKKIYHNRLDYAGTMDGLAHVSSCGNAECCGKYVEKDGILTLVPDEFHGELSVVDWKTSNRLYPEYNLQTVAYQHAIETELNIKVQHRFINRLGKEDGQFESKHLDNSTFDQDLRIFLDALSLYTSINKAKDNEKDFKDKLKKSSKLLSELKKEEKRLAKEETKQSKVKSKQEKKAVLINEL